MMKPAVRPGCLSGSQVPAFPDMKRQSRLKRERVLGRALGRGVSERYRVLEKKTHHEPWNAGVNSSYCRTSLPCALAGASGTRGREHKHWAQPDLEVCLVAGPREYREIEQLDVAEF